MSLARLASQQVVRAPARIQGAGTEQPRSEDHFDLLTKYIPTETMALYIAAMSANVVPEGAKLPLIAPIWLYAAGAVLTPVILFATGYAKQRAENPAERFNPQIWTFASALAAYLIWALAVPGLPLNGAERAFAGFGALLLSTMLGLLDPIFRSRVQAPPNPQ